MKLSKLNPVKPLFKSDGELSKLAMVVKYLVWAAVGAGILAAMVFLAPGITLVFGAASIAWGAAAGLG